MSFGIGLETGASATWQGSTRRYSPGRGEKGPQLQLDSFSLQHGTAFDRANVDLKLLRDGVDIRTVGPHLNIADERKIRVLLVGAQPAAPAR